MEINFVKLLDKTKDGYDALFSVNGNRVKIGVSDTALSVWNVQGSEKTITGFLKQFGSLKIQWMLAENLLKDYTFISDHFKKEDGNIMSVGELDDYLKEKIIEVENKLTKV
ncbi:MAG: hypothetical protein A3H68_01735 [Candidatus Taylorbacteria bacterium RIFCSPLOWO2_02_FULL_46_40]|uniref:Uncharacterized protein n=1 Tax=Candidatus Taylorbacteria bacterium RIFCSPLOWO2_02_FULL_46_40 TaxID=1802329 RepID=A0A1G2P1B9_9BACT|nr:MAG: hypothetical protein A3H68_01735 [Candidatus Taylorbacteria bacterium RIFCSPLOWO2_02_FULL_46_40]